MASSAILRVPWNKAERRRNTANTLTLLEGSNYCSNVSRTHRCRRRRRCRTSSKNDLHDGNSSGRRGGRKKHPAPGGDNSDDSLVDTGLRGTTAGSDATWTTILPPPPSTRCRRRSWRCCQRRSSRHRRWDITSASNRRRNTAIGRCARCYCRYTRSRRLGACRRHLGRNDGRHQRRDDPTAAVLPPPPTSVANSSTASIGPRARAVSPGRRVGRGRRPRSAAPPWRTARVGQGRYR